MHHTKLGLTMKGSFIDGMLVSEGGGSEWHKQAREGQGISLSLKVKSSVEDMGRNTKTNTDKVVDMGTCAKNSGS